MADLPIIVHVRWPGEERRRADLADAGVPRLLLVARGAPPPETWAVDEDWVHEHADAEERVLREETLRRRMEIRGMPVADPAPVVVLDGNGLAHRDGRWVALSAIEAAVLGPLLARQGRGVARRELAAATWPGEERDDRAVDGAVRRLRAKLRELDVEVHGITGYGYLLEGRGSRSG